MLAQLRHANAALAGSLANKLERCTLVHPKQGLDTPKAMQLITGTARICACLYACGLVHCDFKPENIALDTRGNVVGLDFYTAEEVSADANKAEPCTSVGTWLYAAPETQQGHKSFYNAKTDLPALAHCTRAILCGYGCAFYEDCDPNLQPHLAHNLQQALLRRQLPDPHEVDIGQTPASSNGPQVPTQQQAPGSGQAKAAAGLARSPQSQGAPQSDDQQRPSNEQASAQAGGTVAQGASLQNSAGAEGSVAGTRLGSNSAEAAAGGADVINRNGFLGAEQGAQPLAAAAVAAVAAASAAADPGAPGIMPADSTGSHQDADAKAANTNDEEAGNRSAAASDNVAQASDANGPRLQPAPASPSFCTLNSDDVKAMEAAYNRRASGNGQQATRSGLKLQHILQPGCSSDESEAVRDMADKQVLEKKCAIHPLQHAVT